MRYRRNDEWEDSAETYTPNQVEAVLDYCGIEVVTDTHTHFLCYCPFHGNTDSPAFAVDKVKGLSTCFNPSCTISGTLVDLVMKVKKLTIFQAMRVIAKNRNTNNTPFTERLREAMANPDEFVEFPSEVLERAAGDFPGSVAEDYMKSRGFEDETLKYFGVGYSKNKNMVVVPMHDPNGMPIGLIGRTPSHTNKTFKNSVGLPKARTAWNFHRAKRCGETIIICEASYDAMRIHQAGHPNVIALLGGSVTDAHIAQINRNFSTVVIMSDFDKKQYRPNCRMCNYKPCQGHRPGRELGRSIASKLPNKKIMWAAYDDSVVFPHEAKDASDMTDAEIRQCIRNAVSNLTYSQWNVENSVAVTQ